MTEKQERVYQYLREGRSNRQIAEEMQVTLQTVKNHVSAVFIELGVKKRVQLRDPIPIHLKRTALAEAIAEARRQQERERAS